MNLSDRIQSLRKSKGLSQEELADRVGVSRQAVSKWESEQSMPELDKVVTLSEIFEVTTDYLLKGIEPEKKSEDNRLWSRVLYTASTVFIFIGVLAAFACWFERQSLSDVFGAMTAQVLGVAGYFIGRALSGQRASFGVKLLNILGLTFMPCSMLAGLITRRATPYGGPMSPYPLDAGQFVIFAVLYLIISIISVILLRRRR